MIHKYYFIKYYIIFIIHNPILFLVVKLLEKLIYKGAHFLYSLYTRVG